MKKVAIWLGIAAVLGLAGVAIFLRSGGPAKAAAIAPADASIFLNIPNIPLTGFRWTSTAMARIAAEPEVREFLKKPMEKKAGTGSAAAEAGGHLAALKPGNIFASVSPGESGPSVLVGFQFWGGKKDYENAVARLREALPSGEGEPSTRLHRHIEVLATRHGDYELHSAAVGRWGLLSNSAAGIGEAIDRALGESQGAGLDSNERFQKTISELPDSPDFLAFLQPAPAADALGAVQGAAVSMALESLRSTEAIGAAMKIDGGLQRDALFILHPHSKGETPPADTGAIAFTRAETVVFWRDSSFGFGDLPAALRDASAAQPALPRELPQLAEALAACGPGFSVSAEWPEGALAPSPLVAVQTASPETAREALAAAAAVFPGASPSGENGVLSIPSNFGSVQLAAIGNHLLAATDPARLAEAARPEGSAPTLESSPKFRSALPAYRAATGVFCYIDTATAFERLHAAFVPVLRFTAAMVPAIGENVDTAKIPSAASISKHLQPIVLSQRDTARGTLFESSGPVSMGQLLLLGTAGFAAANPSVFSPSEVP